MRGSTKFWLIIASSVLMFLNYLCYKDFQNYDPNRAVGHTVTLATIIFLVIQSVSVIALFIFCIVHFVMDLLPKFNDYLDKHF